VDVNVVAAVFIISIERLCYAGAGAAASVKDAVRAALGQSPSGNAPGLAEEQRVRFWSRPALDSPSLQQRVWHAWGAVQSPTGTPPMSPWPILQQMFVNKLLFADGMHAGSWCMLLCFQSLSGAYQYQICDAALNSGST